MRNLKNDCDANKRCNEKVLLKCQIVTLHVPDHFDEHLKKKCKKNSLKRKTYCQIDKSRLFYNH